MIYDTKVVRKEDCDTVMQRFQLMFVEGWQITPDSLKTAKNENVVYLRKPYNEQ